MDDTNDVLEAQFPVRREGNSWGPEAWCEARNTMSQAGARSFFAVGGGPEDASDNEPNIRLARELHRPEGTCDCDG